MVGSRTWALVGALSVLALLSACTVPGPVPTPLAVLPLPTSTATSATADRAPRAVAEVRGRVLTPRGAPVAGAAVTLRAASEERCGRCGRQAAARTGPDGRFAMAVPEGRYVLACTTPDARPCWFPRAAGPLDVSGPIKDLRLLAPPPRHAHPR